MFLPIRSNILTTVWCCCAARIAFAVVTKKEFDLERNEFVTSISWRFARQLMRCCARNCSNASADLCHE